jgi:hypothetical protein
LHLFELQSGAIVNAEFHPHIAVYKGLSGDVLTGYFDGVRIEDDSLVGETLLGKTYVRD